MTLTFSSIDGLQNNPHTEKYIGLDKQQEQQNTFTHIAYITKKKEETSKDTHTHIKKKREKRKCRKHALVS